jgi:hypothetical protein
MASNSDEAIVTNIDFKGPGGPKVIAIGNFRKTLPHNEYDEVCPNAYEKFKDVALLGGDYDTVPRGAIGAAANYAPGTDLNGKLGDGFNNPQAARSHDKLTGGAAKYEMSPAPGILSRSTAAEFTELQWMAILRDVDFISFAGHSVVQEAINDISNEYKAALYAAEPGGVTLGTDLPQDVNGNLDIRLETLFRCGLRGEDKGPLVSQFFLHDIAYGAQMIVQKVRPYARKCDFLTDHASWLEAQNCGYDQWAHGYSGDNDFITEPKLEEHDDNGTVVPPRRLKTMRDICRFVNKDALHQAYFNAALLCDSWKIPLGKGNPYSEINPDRYARQGGFGTFGGPDILTRVSEVAGRALAIVWRQKWEVHRRARPEAYGGLMQMQKEGYSENGPPVMRPYGLPDAVFDTEASKFLIAGRLNGNKNYYLPMAFSAGAPPHPAYGAGHATVAGACVTVLKAWYDGTVKLQDHLDRRAGKKMTILTPFPGADDESEIKPIVISHTNSGGKLEKYSGNDAEEMTIEGELNKIACNVAMGRSMGGVHWRTDNTRSLRLGEQIACELLRSESEDYAEKRKPDGRAPYWEFVSFNGKNVVISDGKVFVNGTVHDPMAGRL